MDNYNYITLIDENQCLGDSLDPINANFGNLDIAITNALTSISVDDRFVVTESYPVSITDLTFVNLYPGLVSPFLHNLNTIAISSTSGYFTLSAIPALSAGVVVLSAGNYDVDISADGNTWGSNTAFLVALSGNNYLPLLKGITVYSSSSTSTSIIKGVISLSALTIVGVLHYFSQTTLANVKIGLSAAALSAVTADPIYPELQSNTFTTVTIRKI